MIANLSAQYDTSVFFLRNESSIMMIADRENGIIMIKVMKTDIIFAPVEKNTMVEKN